MMISSLRLAVIVAAAWLTPMLAFAQIGVFFEGEKHFSLVADTPITFSDLELYPSPSAYEPAGAVSIEDLPAKGTLYLFGSQSGGSYRYVPDSGFFGRDGFSYRIGDRVFQAWLHVAPAKSPVAGRWQTEHCYRKDNGQEVCDSSSSLGHGSELGWYDAHEKAFVLCDWQGELLVDCVKLPLPTRGSFETWTPLVLDTDGDGWSELALRNPLTGKIRVFAIHSGTELLQPGLLIEVADGMIGQPGDLPFLGDWAVGSDIEVGVYRFTDEDPGLVGHLLLETGNDGPLMVNDLGSSVQRPWPLASDWMNRGKDQVGVYDPDQQGLWLSNATGGAVDFVRIGRSDTSSWVPLATPLARTRTERILMLFESETGGGTFHVYRVRRGIDDPLPLEVAVDPSGGPITFPTG